MNSYHIPLLRKMTTCLLHMLITVLNSAIWKYWNSSEWQGLSTQTLSLRRKDMEKHNVNFQNYFFYFFFHFLAFGLLETTQIKEKINKLVTGFVIFPSKLESTSLLLLFFILLLLLKGLFLCYLQVFWNSRTLLAVNCDFLEIHHSRLNRTFDNLI